MSRLRTIATALAAAALALPAPQVSAAPASPGASRAHGASLTIPWAIGGLRIERDGTKRVFPGEWPSIPVASMRIWDARTAWLNIEPAQDQWDFSRLDAFVTKAEAHGVNDIMLTLGGTPKWAAKQQKKTDAAWLGPGSASPPRRWADWQEFVTKVAERYQGRIDSYEIWNEPNSLTYWSGTEQQWAQLTAIASTAIAKADPSAKVVVGSFATRPARTLMRIPAFLDALGPRQRTAQVLSLHWYPDPAQIDTGLKPILATVDRAARRARLSIGQTWVTEVNVRGGNALSAAAQQAAVRGVERTLTDAGIDRYWWYAWTDLGPPSLLQIHNGMPAAQALAALAR